MNNDELEKNVTQSERNFSRLTLTIKDNIAY